MEIAIGNCIVCMVQLYAVVTELGKVRFKWFVLIRSAGTELRKNVLSTDIRSGGVQDGFKYVSHLVRISYTFHNAP